jgi:nanoRNase/pAp phosphatase (c-di-AMP/oligoRNAs hydrolase)/CBS domain-containing protein
MHQIVTTHKNTDFDAMASTIAATLIYPGTMPLIPKHVNPNVRAFWSIHKDVFELFGIEEIDPEQVDWLIVVDANSWSRLDRPEGFQNRKDLEIILWDHHSPTGDFAASWTCQEEVGATITLLIRRLKQERKLLTPIQATLFLAGLYEDTGNLSFPSTTAEDAAAAAYLLERKADLAIVNKFLRPAYGERQKNVLFEMLKTAERTRINGHSLSFSKLSISGHVDNLAVVVRMYRDIVNVDAAFGIFQNKERGHCMVIGRSQTEALDMGVIMKTLGGGGHPGAGSAMLKSVNPDAVEEMIQELIRGNQQATVRVGDLMSFPVTTVESSLRMNQVACILREKGCTGLPVVEDGRLVGIISRRDFKKVKKSEKLKSPVKAFMSKDVKTIEPDKSLIQAAKLMVRHDIGRLPVVADGRIIGIITRSDTMMYFYDQFPD